VARRRLAAYSGSSASSTGGFTDTPDTMVSFD
jgi:hypothetical protein